MFLDLDIVMYVFDFLCFDTLRYNIQMIHLANVTYV